jgi:hypothetical protein
LLFWSASARALAQAVDRFEAACRLSHARDLTGRFRGHCSSAARASCSASPATSKSPSSRNKVANTRRLGAVNAVDDFAHILVGGLAHRFAVPVRR